MVSPIKDRLQILSKKMKELSYNSYMRKRVKHLVNELEKRDIKGLDKFLQRLINNAGDKEAYLDILMEGRFAKILARNGFCDIQIEFADKGPDIKATWKEETIYFEVTRRRPTEDDKAIQNAAAFVSPDKPENIISKIQGKMPQLRIGETNVIVLWSNTIRLGYKELQEAFKYVQSEINTDPKKYEDLSAVLITVNGGVDMETLKQFNLFNNEKASKPLNPLVAKRLDTLQESDFSRKQKEWDDIAASMSKKSK